MKQIDLFGEEKIIGEDSYTAKIQSPIYEPKNVCPHILELIDDSKTKRLINEITNAEGITSEEKNFLSEAAKRHSAFNYSKIADYYAHASKEMQNLMEKSALVIIDFEQAIELGYVKLSQEVFQSYLTDTGKNG